MSYISFCMALVKYAKPPENCIHGNKASSVNNFFPLPEKKITEKNTPRKGKLDFENKTSSSRICEFFISQIFNSFFFVNLAVLRRTLIGKFFDLIDLNFTLKSYINNVEQLLKFYYSTLQISTRPIKQQKRSQGVMCQ